MVPWTADVLMRAFGYIKCLPMNESWEEWWQKFLRVKETSFVAEIRGLFWREMCVLCEGTRLIKGLRKQTVDFEGFLLLLVAAKKPSALLNIELVEVME